MKMREVIAMQYPERISGTACGGVVGCPRWYGLERSKPKYCKMEEKTCKKCWNRKYDPPKFVPEE